MYTSFIGILINSSEDRMLDYIVLWFNEVKYWPTLRATLSRPTFTYMLDIALSFSLFTVMYIPITYTQSI